MIIPLYLKRGDKIGIVAPAKSIAKADAMFGLNKLHEWGFEVVLGKYVFETHHQFAGNDEQRAADLQAMLDDASIKAIIAIRGGYGTLRIIDQLHFKKFKKNPKWIVGYSDITVLHSHIHKNCGIATLHATMPVNFERNEESVNTLIHTLMGDRMEYSIPAHHLNRIGNASAEIIGGNLSLLYALSGSKSDIDTKGKILFIEDLDEYLYHLDRMMLNLKRSGKLDKLAGLIVGGFSDMKDNATPYGKTAEEIILEHVAEFDYPICFNFPAGHIEKNLALVFGQNARFNVSSNKVELNFI